MLFEVLCLAMGWGRPDLSVDPFVGFHDVNPLFVLNEEGDRYEVPVARQGYFRPESFAAEKPADEFRIFCLGGSTVQGRPFAIETSFTTWLEISLNSADASRSWEVVNCGGVSYATYRLIPILREVLDHQPDMIILCTGQNEFLEDRTFDHIKRRPPIVKHSLSAASKMRTFHVLRNGWFSLTNRDSYETLDERPLLPTEVTALLDEQGGMETYHRDDVWRESIIEQYRFNLIRMVELSQEAGVPIVLINPVCNLRDCPPFKSEHRSELTADQLLDWETLTDTARERLACRVPEVAEATTLWEQACELDPLHAGEYFELARCYDRAGQTEEAKSAYLTAKELDVCPLRMLEPMQAAVIETADRMSVPLVDAQELFERVTPDGIVDGRWLVDHVHPSIQGHQLLADRVAELLVRLGTITPGENWEEERTRAYQTHTESLPDYYYIKGLKRLKVVQNWARGRAGVDPATFRGSTDASDD